MSEGFGPDFITITDEDGNEFELEHLDTIEYNGQTYMAFFPAVEDEGGEAVEDVDLDEVDGEPFPVLQQKQAEAESSDTGEDP